MLGLESPSLRRKTILMVYDKNYYHVHVSRDSDLKVSPGFEPDTATVGLDLEDVLVVAGDGGRGEGAVSSLLHLVSLQPDQVPSGAPQVALTLL